MELKASTVTLAAISPTPRSRVWRAWAAQAMLPGLAQTTTLAVQATTPTKDHSTRVSHPAAPYPSSLQVPPSSPVILARSTCVVPVPARKGRSSRDLGWHTPLPCTTLRTEAWRRRCSSQLECGCLKVRAYIVTKRSFQKWNKYCCR